MISYNDNILTFPIIIANLKKNNNSVSFKLYNLILNKMYVNN